MTTGMNLRSKLRGIIPSALRDCSTCQFRLVTSRDLQVIRLFALLAELEFHKKTADRDFLAAVSNFL